MALSPGDRFDRYVIEELLGEGGMARVYRAHDPRLHRRVALKVLRHDSSSDPDAAVEASARVMREARAAAALDHPNAVPVFDVGEADGALFIAMELVVGKSLRAYVGDSTVPWDTKLRWMVDAARALGAAHERGLVHRDVKPENIMVRNDGVVKVLDFGIAKRVIVDVQTGSASEETFGGSLQGKVVGTPWYLSPEQLRGDPVDARADQFAWGVTAYELLTGSLPWPKGADGFQLVLAILNRVPPPPSEVIPLPSIVDATIMKALAKQPSLRFGAMEYVVSALEGVTSNSRRSFAEIHIGTTETDPAPPLGRDDAHPPTARTPSAEVPTLESARPKLRRSMRRRAVVSAAVVTFSIVAAFAWLRTKTTVTPAAPAAAASGPAPTALTDLPLPPSPVEQARKDFHDYLARFRDADWDGAIQALRSAVKNDPSMATAHLRLAFMESLVNDDEDLVRTSFKEAARNASTLSERDMTLLDALEPYLQRAPSDPTETERRLVSMRARWPLDAEVAYDLGSVRYDHGDLPGALEAFDAALAVDPAFAQASATRGGVLAYLGRFDEALAALDESMQRSRSATEPLWYRAQIHEQQGACAEEENDVHVWLSRNPDDYLGYQWLARALAAQNKPIDSVQAALEQKWGRMSGDERDRVRAYDAATLAALAGDFATAQARIEELQKMLASEPEAQTHGLADGLLLAVAEESGGADRARSVAQAYLARKDAWAAPHRVDDGVIWSDPVPPMMLALARSGAITTTELGTRRTQWLHEWRGKTHDAYIGYLWIAGWARTVSTPAEARAALDARKDFPALPPFAPVSVASSYVGETYALAGEQAKAIATLQAARASCTELEFPVEHVRGVFSLGQVLEDAGETARACDAYSEVVARWGAAKPRSLTAERAKARMKKLACR